MHRPLLALSVTLACALSASACVRPTPELVRDQPPKVDAPSWADEACRIGSLPETELTQADMETALYGAWDVIAICRKAIRLEQEAHLQERQAVADWIEE